MNGTDSSIRRCIGEDVGGRREKGGGGGRGRNVEEEEEGGRTEGEGGVMPNKMKRREREE
jgi:hypothetical protein